MDTRPLNVQTFLKISDNHSFKTFKTFHSFKKSKKSAAGAEVVEYFPDPSNP